MQSEILPYQFLSVVSIRAQISGIILKGNRLAQRICIPCSSTNVYNILAILHVLKIFHITNNNLFLHLSCQLTGLQFSSLQSLSHVRLFATPWIAAHYASLSITNSQSSLRLMSIKSVMPSSHLILWCLLLLPLIPPSIRVFSNESTLCMRWPKYWSFSFSIVPSKEHPEMISFRMDWLALQLHQ